MTQGILILLFMLVIMGLMVTRKMPTVLALFVLTVEICLIGGVPPMAVDAEGNAVGFLQTVMQSGAVKLGDAIMVAIFAGWLGMVMEKTRISETMIKKGAELGGDKTFIVTIILFTVAALLFTTVNGLGNCNYDWNNRNSDPGVRWGRQIYSYCGYAVCLLCRQ